MTLPPTSIQHDVDSGGGSHGIETRFRDAQLAPIFGDLDGFVSAAQDTQYRALKYQIETLRWAEPISGYIITELNDTQWEANGLLQVKELLAKGTHIVPRVKPPVPPLRRHASAASSPAASTSSASSRPLP